MATLTTERRSGKTTGYNVQWYDGKRRITIHLGGKRYTKKTAERFKDIVEALLFYRRNGITTPEKSVEHWMQNAPVELKAKLAKAELLIVDEAKTCQQLWDSFLKFKAMEVKPSTLKSYQDSMARFYEMFKPTELLEAITPERLLEWKASMQDDYAKSSITMYISKLQTVFKWAVDKDWLTKSPARNLPKSGSRNREHDRFITMEEYSKLLAACPNQEWRTIIALARIGGLRCPSELRQLRWKDVMQDRFTVHSPKTEHHEGQDIRIVPLFDELREELDKHDKTTEFVVQGFQGTSWGLYLPFQEISERAGLGVIKCPFRNMRRSRANDVLRQWDEAMERMWIGHSWEVMEKHYLMQLDEDFSTC